MKRRFVPSPALVTNTGLFKPDATRVNVKEPLATVAEVGDGSGGDVVAVGLGLAPTGGVGLGLCAVWGEQPAASTSNTAKANANRRMTETG